MFVLRVFKFLALSLRVISYLSVCKIFLFYLFMSDTFQLNLSQLVFLEPILCWQLNLFLFPNSNYPQFCDPEDS